MKTNDLKELILARPDLEITPLVSDDATCADYGWTIANVSRCSIDGIAMSPINEERMLVYSTDIDDFIANYCDSHDDLELSDEEFTQRAEEEYENLPWEETILLYVDAY